MDHPLFASQLLHALEVRDVTNDSAFSRNDYKDQVREAVRAVRHHLQRVIATTHLEKLHWATLALRGSLCSEWLDVERILPRWLPLSRAHQKHGRSQGFIRAARSMVRTLHQAEVDAEIRSIEDEIAAFTCEIDDAKVEAAKQQLARARARRERWGLTRRRVVLSSVLQPDGSAAADDAEAADLLRQHWSGVAQGRTVDEGRFMSFRPYIQRVLDRVWTHPRISVTSLFLDEIPFPVPMVCRYRSGELVAIMQHMFYTVATYTYMKMATVRFISAPLCLPSFGKMMQVTARLLPPRLSCGRSASPTLTAS